jgi:hypothetical protein
VAQFEYEGGLTEAALSLQDFSGAISRLIQRHLEPLSPGPGRGARYKTEFKN